MPASTLVSAPRQCHREEGTVRSQKEETAGPTPAVIVHPEHEDAVLLPSQDLVCLIKHASPCAAMRKRQDNRNRDEHYKPFIRMRNAEQNELLREIIHRRRRRQHLRYGSSSPDRPGCGKTLFLRFAMYLYNRYSNTGNNTTYNAFVICASTGKAAVAVGGTTVHAGFKLSRKTTGPNKDGGLSASELNTFRGAFRNVK
ncbi:hypothetical protein HPB48_017708 [Haemaphysalis longicornis]|uniref:DNA helicase n=1 Tax=Haemaphysalis longicornis TaxID=44386 RepID=A0A9J6GRR4_HAELO|nr:hypothetical protein HPB48_017708 [Haemaphysalis longicornis]